MNPKRRILFALTLTLMLIPGLGAETVIDQLVGLRKYELADSYYAAGQRFTALGQTDRGAEFRSAALRLFPGYVPGQAAALQAAVALQTPPKPEPKLPSADLVKEKNIQGEKIAKLQFQKLLRGYLTGNAATVLSVLAEPDAPAVTAFLEAHPAEAGSPDDLFLMDSLQFTDGEKEAVLITIQANPEAPGDLASVVPFWKGQQRYTFVRVGDTWKLSGVEGN